MRPFLRISLLVVITASAFAQQPAAEPAKSPFAYQEVMIPMRDGVHLQTVILTPVDQKGPLPIILSRTPYGVRDKAPEKVPANLRELAQDGYIFVSQNLRGRFKSEGVFKLSSYVDLNDPKATTETTDAYDTIDAPSKSLWRPNSRPRKSASLDCWQTDRYTMNEGLPVD